ncbi:MAG: FKBP-type peptidyl-prolyl cis-trans isomerase [Alphaproteobacteria bacterium]|nr:FKBP-type peptidyl-prolyl cis-trans isomerase [Alphaproteobacteria bacterium]MBV9061861.1 FKBP-type peptidyl-prolyl cis-trans isomerase [Alphaproteobacteria bacterium]
MKRLGVLAGGLAMLALPAHALDSALSPQANAAFLSANAKKPGVVVEASGLQHRPIHSGYGKRPHAADLVTVNYKGTLINGTVFDATEPGLPAQFTVNKLIPGWTEALQLMREGDEWELVIPASLAYGARGAGDSIPPNQTLVFDLTLISVSPPPPPPPGKENQ